MEPVDEKQIILLCQNGNKEYYDILIRKYEKPLYKYCYYLAGNPQEANDLFQETWLKVIDRIESYNMEYTFKTWLLSIASNAYKDHYRKKMQWSKKIRSFFTNESMTLEFEKIVSEDPLIEDNLINQESLHALRVAVHRLKWHYRAVIILYYFEEQSIQDIGNILNIPNGTVKSRLNQGKKLLRNLVEVER